MVETLAIASIAVLSIAIIVALIVVRLQRISLNRALAQIHAWERAQESRQQQWQEQQERRVEALGKQVTIRVEQVQDEWHAWEMQEAEVQRQESRLLRSRVEHELARLRLVEDVPFQRDSKGQRRPQEVGWQAAYLQEADLSGRDLSRMYLGYANLRGSKLVHANLFMADLSNACLAGADLSHTNLAAANLVGADLRGALLFETNVRVADMDDALLLGANLVNIRNLTLEQLASTIYDGTTQFGPALASTIPPLPDQRQAELPLLPSTPEEPASASGIPAEEDA